jgi:hypothetical protein
MGGCDDRTMNADTEPRLLGSLSIGSRFRGPKGCGNGGYTAGLLASYLRGEVAGPAESAGPIEVTLRQPSPLDTSLVVTADARGVQLRTDEGTTVAEATVALPRPREVVEPVPYDEAARAEAAFGGRDKHPFAECFVCGTSRTPDDALCLRPGSLGDGRTACTWVPTSSVGVDLPVVWGVLDCPSGWTADVVGQPIVLGRIRATVDAVPALGTRCVVMGELLGAEGRKVHTASTVYDEDGRLVASARQVWIAVDPTAFGEE